MSICELTKYPNLFKNTYWGNFCINNSSVSEQIINNRNYIADLFELSKYIDEEEYPNFITSELTNLITKNCISDHGECYITKNGNYLLIVSPYVSDDYNYIKNNWICSPQLYSKDTSTYIKIIKRKEKKPIKIVKTIKNKKSYKKSYKKYYNKK